MHLNIYRLNLPDVCRILWGLSVGNQDGVGEGLDSTFYSTAGNITIDLISVFQYSCLGAL